MSVARLDAEQAQTEDARLHRVHHYPNVNSVLVACAMEIIPYLQSLSLVTSGIATYSLASVQI